MPAAQEKVELELMWEGVESFYFAYGNGYTYVRKLDGWHKNVERTILLDFRGRNVRCYYDREEMQRASDSALPDFLSQEWVEQFLEHSRVLLAHSEAFIEEAHMRSVRIERELLVDRVVRGTEIMTDTLIAFHATQPQYSSGIEPYLRSLMPDLSKEEQQAVIATLAQSEESTLLSEEEDAWAEVVARIKDSNAAIPRSSDELAASILDEHARQYGLVHAADAQPAADRANLHARLERDWERTDLAKDRDAEHRAISEEKKAILTKHSLSPEVLRICDTLARMSHIRLETRLRGWMPLEKILADELIPELARFLPYTSTQLESCTPAELLVLMNDGAQPTQEELDERIRHVVVGMYKGKEILWTGDDIDAKFTPLLPIIDHEATEITGQPAMKGKVQGLCHVINWDVDLSAAQMEEMPQGAILVAGQTRPQLMNALKKAGAIVTDEGGLLSHAAIVARELRIPCVIGTKYATKILKNGDMVEVDGDAGIVRKI